MTHPIPTYRHVFDRYRKGESLLALYSEHFDQIRKEMVAFGGLKQSIVYPNGTVESDRLRVGLVMSDLYDLSLTGLGEVEFSVFARSLKTRGIRGLDPTGRFEIHEPILVQGKAVIGAGLVTAKGPRFEKVANALEPLIDAGQLMLSPHGVVFAGDENTSGHQFSGTMFGVDCWRPRSEWIDAAVSRYEGDDQSTMPPTPLGAVGQIVVPFLRGVTLRELSLILTGERDKLNTFRATLKKLADEATSQGVDVGEYINDVVRPELEKLTRAFRHISRIQGLKAGGAVVLGTTAALLAPVPAAGALVGGGLGAKAFHDVVQWVEKRAELRNDPLYVLWRINRRSARPL